MRFVILAAALAAAALPAAASAQSSKVCVAGSCIMQLTPPQLLAAAERLVQAGRYDEARPLIAALRQAPGYGVQTRFLTGFIAAQQGDYAEAVRQYEAILADDPRQTRVRLELAKALIQLHQTASADRQFKLAAQDRELPPDIARTIRTVRDVIRANRAWRFNIDFGIAPDTNINNATTSESVNVNLGDLSLPLTLGSDARARSGLGETATISTGVRLPIAKNSSMLVDLDASGTNYGGTRFDDYQVQLASGPELRVFERASVSLEGLGAVRWYGGHPVSRQLGARASGQTTVGTHGQLGVQLDVRRTRAFFDRGYDGWQAGLYATYEYGLSPTLVLSAGPFLRRDALRQDAYSNVEGGGTVGIGGAAPLGIEFGVSGSVSRAVYNGALPLFSIAPRRDWRYMTRATLGDRKIRLFGFSPQLSWTMTRIDSSLDFFRTRRNRFAIEAARYF